MKLTHLGLYLKLTQYCKSTILQFKKGVCEISCSQKKKKKEKEKEKKRN